MIKSKPKVAQLNIGRSRNDDVSFVLVYAENDTPTPLDDKQVQIIFEDLRTGANYLIKTPSQYDANKAIVSLTDVDKTRIRQDVTGISIRIEGVTVAKGNFTWSEEFSASSANPEAIGINYRTLDETVEWFDVVVGPRGKSAYETAVDGGYDGTEEEFNSLLADLPNARDEAEAARDIAVQAKDDAEAARDIAVPAASVATEAKEDAEDARDIAVSAKDDALLAQSAAESARDIAVQAKDDAEDARDEAVLAKEAAEFAASTIDGSGEVQEGEVKLVSGGKVFDYVSPLTAEVEKLSTIIVNGPKKNLLNPENFDFTKRYSPGGASIVGRGSTIYAGSGYIPVEEGKWYIFSIRDGVGGLSSPGAFCTSEGQTSGLIKIDYVIPVDGIGRCFQVPMGLGITHVYLNLLCIDTASNVLDGKHQLEEGEQATEYEEYQLVDKINPIYLPETTTSTVDDKHYEKYTTFGNLSYAGISDRISNFRKHWIAKDKDLVVVNTGTSLTARSTEHCTDHPKARERPPLMHSNNFASHIWDKLKWDNQHYRRYDYPGFFTETGSFQTQSNIADWDDGAYRAGLTRYSNGSAATISFQIPVDAWQFNFIFRSDSVATESATITVSEGNGQLEVWNGSAWVEANGFVFSQREPAPATIPGLSNVRPEDGGTQVHGVYQVKGNTTYQKRLKMRCKGTIIDSRSVTKSVTISAAAGRLTYWGVEWSKREHMITYINAARGSHNSTIASTSCLARFQDNEVWSFRPDLLLTEDPIHNSGASGNLNLTRPKAYYSRITDNFFFNPNNSVSIVASAARLGLPVPEMVIFNSSLSWNFNGIDDSGELIVYDIVDGQWTALDAQMSCWEYVTENYPDVIYINAVKTWVEAGRAIFGDLKSATIGSGKSGKTFTNEGSHWNDTGSRIMARVVLPVLDFLH